MTNHSPPPLSRSPWAKPIAALALIFGIMTLFSGGSVLFGPADARSMAGNYVGFVVWFNFLAGGVYIIAAIGLWRGKSWAGPLAALIALATALVGVGFAIVIMRGAAFELRTVIALTIRFAFWAMVATLALRGAKRA